MTSSSCVAAVACVAPQCFLGLVLLMTSLSQHVLSQGSTSTIRLLSTSRSAAYNSPLPSGDAATVTSSDWRSLANKTASNVTVLAANKTNESSTYSPQHQRNSTSATVTTLPTEQERLRTQEDVVDSAVSSDYASQTEDIYSYHSENWDSNQEGNDDDDQEADGNHDDDDDDVNNNEYLESHEDYYQESNAPERPAFNYSSDYDANSHGGLQYYGGDNEMRRGESDSAADDPSRVNFDVHLVRDIPSEDFSPRRLITSGSLSLRSEPINMSLLVIYSWLGLVVVMIVCTIIIYKYKDPMNNAWQSFYLSLCHRNKRSRGIEESNTLLTHPLV